MVAPPSHLPGDGGFCSSVAVQVPSLKHPALCNSKGRRRIGQVATRVVSQLNLGLNSLAIYVRIDAVVPTPTALSQLPST